MIKQNKYILNGSSNNFFGEPGDYHNSDNHYIKKLTEINGLFPNLACNIHNPNPNCNYINEHIKPGNDENGRIWWKKKHALNNISKQVTKKSQQFQRSRKYKLNKTYQIAKQAAQQATQRARKLSGKKSKRKHIFFQKKHMSIVLKL